MRSHIIFLKKKKKIAPGVAWLSLDLWQGPIRTWALSLAQIFRNQISFRAARHPHSATAQWRLERVWKAGGGGGREKPFKNSMERHYAGMQLTNMHLAWTAIKNCHFKWGHFPSEFQLHYSYLPTRFAINGSSHFRGYITFSSGFGTPNKTGMGSSAIRFHYLTGDLIGVFGGARVEGVEKGKS